MTAGHNQHLLAMIMDRNISEKKNPLEERAELASYVKNDYDDLSFMQKLASLNFVVQASVLSIFSY